MSTAENSASVRRQLATINIYFYEIKQLCFVRFRALEIYLAYLTKHFICSTEMPGDYLKWSRRKNDENRIILTGKPGILRWR